MSHALEQYVRRHFPLRKSVSSWFPNSCGNRICDTWIKWVSKGEWTMRVIFLRCKLTSRVTMATVVRSIVFNSNVDRPTLKSLRSIPSFSRIDPRRPKSSIRCLNITSNLLKRSAELIQDASFMKYLGTIDMIHSRVEPKSSQYLIAASILRVCWISWWYSKPSCDIDPCVFERRVGLWRSLEKVETLDWHYFEW